VTETQGPPVDSDWEPRWDPEPDQAPPPPRPGSGHHRAPLGLSQAAGRVLAPLAAVGVVVAVILLLIWINGRPASVGSAGSANAAVTPVTRTTPVAPAGSTAATPPASPPASRHHASSSPSATATTQRHRRTTAAVATAKAPVQVLNNSRRTGLAHEVATLVQSKGWQVSSVGNLQGSIAVPTVYYSSGNKSAAEHLAREFPSISRVEPNSAVGLTATGITLVLTAAWSG
jgi:LytR cell envelope-related transcriptional attenuator